MRDEEFEWDDTKAASNFAKNRISFEMARAAFADPACVDSDDPDPDEERYKRLCMYSGRLLVVIYTERGRCIRIISARTANKHDRRAYDNH